MAGFVDHIDHPEIREFYRLWLALRRGRLVPSRADFDPAAIRAYLPHVFMVDVEDGGARFRYRLCGTAVAAVYGDFTGRYVDEFVSPSFRDTAIERLRDVATKLHVHYLVQALTWQDRPHIRYRRLLLPLSDDQRFANILLGIVYAETDIAGALLPSARRDRLVVENIVDETAAASAAQ